VAGFAVIVSALTLVSLQSLVVAWWGGVWPLKKKCYVGNCTKGMAHQLSHN